MKKPTPPFDTDNLKLNSNIRNVIDEAKTVTRRQELPRRRFLKQPVFLGGSMLAIGALGGKAFAASGDDATLAFKPHFDDDDDYRVRSGLGIVIVGASSGLGAEMARQYADHGAYIVLAARRTERLQRVAAEVSQRGGTPLVITTDVRDEAQCKSLIEESIAWLATQGKGIDILALASIRVQGAVIGPERSSEVWRMVMETNYFGPAFCLKYAVPHLKQQRSTVFYFNSMTASVPLASAVGYVSAKHAWRGILNVLAAENPELTTISSYFNAIDTEAWDKTLTMFNNDKRYCPSLVRTSLIPTENMYPKSVAVEKVVRAIETKTSEAFLSVLNKAAWMIGFTRVQLGGFLVMIENGLPWSYKQQLEPAIKRSLKGPDAPAYISHLLRKLGDKQASNELVEAARYVMSMDESVALYLLALDDRLDSATLAAIRQGYDAWQQSYADGSTQQLELAISSGILSPSGIADDDDGFAPIDDCAPAEY